MIKLMTPVILTVIYLPLLKGPSNSAQTMTSKNFFTASLFYSTPNIRPQDNKRALNLNIGRNNIYLQGQMMIMESMWCFLCLEALVVNLT